MKGSTPTCFGVIMHLHSAHVPPVESRALRKLISQFAHLELSLAVTSSFQHGPMCSLSAIQEEVSLCCWTAGSLCSFCSWPQLLGRAKGGLQCLSPSQALPGPPQLDSPDSINTLQRAVHSWIPAQPWHCEIFQVTALSMTMFKVSTPSLPFHSSLIPLHYSFTSKSAEIHGSCSAQWRCLGKLAIILYPFNFISHANQTPESVWSSVWSSVRIDTDWILVINSLDLEVEGSGFECRVYHLWLEVSEVFMYKNRIDLTS